MAKRYQRGLFFWFTMYLFFYWIRFGPHVAYSKPIATKESTKESGRR